jgi:hypothetical protein
MNGGMQQQPLRSPKREWAEKIWGWNIGTITTTTVPVESLLPFNKQENLYVIRPMAVVGLKVPRELSEKEIIDNYKITQ